MDSGTDKEVFRNLRSLLQSGDYFSYSNSLSELSNINYKDPDGVSFF